MMRAVLGIACLSLVVTACGTEEPAPLKNPPGGAQSVCTATQPSESSCADNLDNDCDGFIDANDPDCAGQNNNPPNNTDECTAPTECTEISDAAVCLENGGVPAGAASCDAQTGEGCPVGTSPFGATDPSGAQVCVCLVECTPGGGGGGGGGGDTTCNDGGTCTAITGADVCLDNGGAPAGAESCDGGVTCPAGDIPATASDGSGGEMCICLEECDLGGGDPPPTGDCPVGTCTAITGGSVCLEGGGIPAGAPDCGADNSCGTDMVPVTVDDGAGNTSCVCLYDC